jgi:hypothetical protein
MKGSDSTSAAIKQWVADHTRDMRVMLPARVLTYYPATQSADVQPVLLTTILGQPPALLPPVRGVPVIFQRTAKTYFVLPLAAGDMVTLFFSDSSLDIFLTGASAQNVDPLDTRAHNLTDAVAYPGLYPFGEAIAPAAGVNATDLVMGRICAAGKAEVRIGPDGTITITNGANFVKVGADGAVQASAAKAASLIGGESAAVDAPVVDVNASQGDCDIQAAAKIHLGDPNNGLGVVGLGAATSEQATEIINALATAIVAILAAGAPSMVITNGQVTPLLLTAFQSIIPAVQSQKTLVSLL